MKQPLLILCLVWLCWSCNTPETYEPKTFQGLSLTGDSLLMANRTEEQLKPLMDNLKEAQDNFNSEASEMNTVWLGRRFAYLMDYQKAIDVFSEGIERFPNSYKLLRHRGHRYISLRQFDKAVADFEKAHALMPIGVTDTEPDGAPNKMNIPLSNTQFNILYHYGLALYLQGNFAEAELIYRECMEYSDNPDLRVATMDWLYMTLRRQGKTDSAKALLSSLDKEAEIIENDSYFKRLLMYSGDLEVKALFETDNDDAALSLATQGYGVANWHLYNGRIEEALSLFEQLLESPSWSAFGYIAAEADYARLQSELQ
mgnify:CR=1 FL=1